MAHHNHLQMMVEKVIHWWCWWWWCWSLMIWKDNKDNKSVGGEVDLLLAAVVARQVELVGGGRLQQVAVGGLGGGWHHLGGSGHHLGGVGLQDVSGWNHHYITCNITLRQTHLGLERIFGAKWGVSTCWREYTMYKRTCFVTRHFHLITSQTPLQIKKWPEKLQRSWITNQNWFSPTWGRMSFCSLFSSPPTGLMNNLMVMWPIEWL